MQNNQKDQLKINSFTNSNLNAWISTSSGIFILFAYVKYMLKSTLSIYETMQILGISAFDKTSIKELLTEIQVNQNVKELYDLFDNKF